MEADQAPELQAMTRGIGRGLGSSSPNRCSPQAWPAPATAAEGVDSATPKAMLNRWKYERPELISRSIGAQPSRDPGADDRAPLGNQNASPKVKRVERAPEPAVTKRNVAVPPAEPEQGPQSLNERPRHSTRLTKTQGG